MKTSIGRIALSATTAIWTFGGLSAGAAHAQSAPTGSETPSAALPGTTAADSDPKSAEIVVTGSRIRRAQADMSSPTIIVGAEQLEERGYVQAGELLNTITSITPSYQFSPVNGNSAGSGQQSPNLFNLGAGRTLTLIDGVRMTSTSPDNGEPVVNTNIVPIGLLSRLEVVQGTGSAVYGSGAIAGVINYVLKKNFDGLQIDGQAGLSTYGDFPKSSITAVAGKNFAEGRGNIAVDVEWRKSGSLLIRDRPWAFSRPRNNTNPLNTGEADGIPATTPVYDAHFWTRSYNGAIFTGRSTASITNLLGYTTANPRGYQFSPDARTVIPYNPGAQYVPGFNCGPNFCGGPSDGYRYNDSISALASAVESRSATAVGHFDITDRLTISGQFLYARNVGSDPYGAQLTSAIVGFNRTNPYLSAADVTQLSALSPAFASGGNLFVSKVFGGPNGVDTLRNTREFRYTTDTYRGVINLEGSFRLFGRDFDYAGMFTRSISDNDNNRTLVSNSRLTRAYTVARNAAGQIVCSINADSSTANDDPACAPISLFGSGGVSQAAIGYVALPANVVSRNSTSNGLATLSGSMFTLPAGDLKFSLGYEYRLEDSRQTPSAASQAGLLGTESLPVYGKYHTNEFSSELLLPILGRDFDLGQRLIEKLEVNGQYRRVDNSLAGRESVWGIGGVMDLVGGFSFRASHGRNFRAPTLEQLISPVSVDVDGGINDPCDARNLSSGNAANRQANCLADFQANPAWGLVGLTSIPAGSSASSRLANFTSAAVNCGTCVDVSSGGNPALRNEVARNTTFGVTWAPTFIPGRLVVSADRVSIDIRNGISAYAPTDFMVACYDAVPRPAGICGTFSRDVVSGDVITAQSTFVNADLIQYRGDMYRFDYTFPLSWITGSEAGNLNLGVEATHTLRYDTVIAGVRTENVGTRNSPSWNVRGDVRYAIGGLKIAYQLLYLSPVKASPEASIETTWYPSIGANAQHSVSASYQVTKQYEIRAGVSNLTNRAPSFPTITYGSPYGRQIFVGFRASLD